MKINPTIQELIDKKVLDANEEREPSGRMSAGRLGNPLQWQVLHYLKVPTKPLDPYTLRKFQRGKDVEDRIVEWLQPEKSQVECKYRNVVGYLDAIHNDLPVEVKSVTNMAFKYLQKGGAKLGHRLQAMCYAKALGYDRFIVAYVASDDYRVLAFEEKVTDEVDRAIDLYEEALKKKTIPLFVPLEKWQSMEKYSPYPEYMKLNEEQLQEKYNELTK